MNGSRALCAVILAAAACAPQQKVKSVRQASADAKAQQAAAAAQTPAATPAEPAAAPAATPPVKMAEPAPAPAPEAAPPAPPPVKMAEPAPAPAPEAAPPAPPPVKMAEPAPAPAPEAAPPPVKMAEPAPAPRADDAPIPVPMRSPPQTVAAPPPVAPPKPRVPDEPVAPLGPADRRPAYAAATGERGGLCVQRPADAVTTPLRELSPSMDNLSGPRVVTLAANEHATLAVQAQFRTGAIDDPPGKAGLTLLTAQLMAYGGTQSLDSKELRAALFPTAAQFQVRVDKELTTFSTRLHKDHVDKVTPIFAEMLTRPRWDEKEFARIRDRAVNDVAQRLRQTDDENLGKEALGELMFAGHPYGRVDEGHESDLKSITLEEVKAHAARVFTADRLTVGVAGGAPEGLGQDLAKALGQLPARGVPTVAVPTQKPHALRYRLVEKPGQATAVSIGMPWTLSRDNPDFVALSVARSAFGEHRQSHGRLMQRLRELRGLNYGDYAYIEHFEQDGRGAAQAQTGRARHQQEFTLWLRPVQNENALFALRAALYQLHRSLVEEPFSDGEVARIKDFLAGYLLQFDQTDARKLGYALDDQALGLHREPGFLDEWRRKLAAVTTAEVNAAWRRWVDPCALQMVLITPDAAATKKALLSGDPTPIQYQRDGQGKTAEKPAAILDEDKQIEVFSFGTPGDADIDVVPVAQMFQ